MTLEMMAARSTLGGLLRLSRIPLLILAAMTCLLLAASPAMAQNADLDIKLFSSVTQPLAGEQFTYTIIVDNLGPDTANDVIIQDTLVTSNSVDPNGCSIAIRTEGGAIDEFSCNFALSAGVFDLGLYGSNYLNPRGQNCTDPTDSVCAEFGGRDPGRAIITVNLTAQEGQTVTSTADVSSLTNDPDLSNNTATVVNDWQSVADLGVSKTATTVSANAGETVTWDITVENFGPSSAQNVEMLDSLPAGLVPGSVSLTGNIVSDVSGSPTVEGPVSCSSGTVGDPGHPAACDLGGLPVGWGAQITVEGLVSPDYIAVTGQTPPLGLDNSVSVSSETLDANFEEVDGNCSPGINPCPPAPDQPNFAHAAVSLSDSANLALSQFAVGTVVAGDSFHYEFQVANSGPSVSRDVSLRSFLPEGIVFENAVVDFEGSTGFEELSCMVTEGSNALFCPLGDIPLTGGSPILVFVNVSVDTSVPDGSQLTNTADVSLTDTSDPDSTNNSDSVNVTVSNPLDIDFFTEPFAGGAVDLEGRQIELRPSTSDDMYTACVRNVEVPPVTTGTTLSLDDDDAVEVQLSGGKKIRFYGRKYDRFHVSSNGYITLGRADTEYLPTLETHFSVKRIAPFFADLDPRMAGEIWWRQTADRVVVAWDGVPGYKAATTNTVYLEMFFSGEIFMRYASLDGLESVVGFSRGLGVPDPFHASDFDGSAQYPECSTVTGRIFKDAFRGF